ncbi:hypothetical protein KKE78_03365 [Patescibacteria group bacterium]|nr:hypothetical protein [Patescibacteria group bacterium]
MKKELIVILLLILICFPAVKALLQPGGFTSHDLTHHIVRQISMDKLLSEGQFPPRWSGELNKGFGYPVFLFNYPLPAFLGEVFHKLGFNFVSSVKTVLFTSMIISVLGMYLFLKELLESRLSAFLGAVFYLYAPLRFLYVYVSAATGSALALGIIPFIFWSITLVAKEKKRWAVLGGAVFLAGLILAHNVTAIIFLPVILAFSLVYPALRSDNLAKNYYRSLALMFLLGLGLSVWFWLPAVFEKQYICFDEIFSGFYKDQFVNLWQLIRSPWGYGLSHPKNPEPGDMSYQLGLMQIAVVVSLAALLFFKRKIREFRSVGVFVIILFVISVFMMLEISLPLWNNLPFLSLIQFPLRFQAVSVFSASIAAALLIKNMPHRSFLFLALLFLVLYANRNHWNINEKFDPGEKYYLNLKTTSTSYAEHLPKWGKIMNRKSLGKFEFITGGGKISLAKDYSAEVLAEIEVTGSSRLRFNQFYFPGWEIEVDGAQTYFDYLTTGESYGLPVFDISKGKHLVKAEFKNTSVRDIADGIGMVSALAWLVLAVRLTMVR